MEFKDLAAGHVTVKGNILEDDADRFPDFLWVVCHIVPGNGCGPFLDREKRNQDVDRRALAGAVWSEEREDLTFLHLKTYPVDCGKITVAVIEIFH